MKKLTIAAFVAAQALTVAQPAQAGMIAAASEIRPGAFAGLRVRVPFDGGRDQR